MKRLLLVPTLIFTLFLIIALPDTIHAQDEDDKPVTTTRPDGSTETIYPEDDPEHPGQTIITYPDDHPDSPGAVEIHHPDGRLEVTLENGTHSVRYPENDPEYPGQTITTYPDDHPDMPGAQATVYYEGERAGEVEIHHGDGRIELSRPDGSHTTSYPENDPDHPSETITTYPDDHPDMPGATVIVYGEGSAYPGSVEVFYPDGTFEVTNPDGSRSIAYSEDDPDHPGQTITTYPDDHPDMPGAEVTVYNTGERAGEVETHHKDGRIELDRPDGSHTTSYPENDPDHPDQTITTYPDDHPENPGQTVIVYGEGSSFPGSLEVHHPDGRVEISHEDGSYTNNYPENDPDHPSQIVTTYPDDHPKYPGEKVIVYKKGSSKAGIVETYYPDGRVMTTYPKDHPEYPGQTIMRYPDGREEVVEGGRPEDAPPVTELDPAYPEWDEEEEEQTDEDDTGYIISGGGDEETDSETSTSGSDAETGSDDEGSDWATIEITGIPWVNTVWYLRVDGWIYRMFISPNPNKLAIASESNVQVYDIGEVRAAVNEGLSPHDTVIEPFMTLTGEAFVEDVAIGPASTLLAASGEDGLVHVWNIESGEETANFSVGAQPATSVAFSPDGSLLAAGSNSSGVFVWDLVSGENIAQLPAEDAVWSMTFNPEGSLLAYPDGNSVRLWKVGEETEPEILQEHTDKVWTVAFNHDGKLLASGGWDFNIVLWDIETSEPVQTLAGHTRLVNKVAFNPDGTLLASGADDLTVRLWEVASGEELRALEGHTDRGVIAAFHPFGDLLITGAWDGQILFWGVAPQHDTQTPEETDVETQPDTEESEPEASCVISANNNINMRGGPGTNYDVVGTLTAGQTMDAGGQATGEDGFVWWHLVIDAWVREDVVEEAGDCGALPEVQP